MNFKKLSAAVLAGSMLLMCACTGDLPILHSHVDSDSDGVCDECGETIKEAPPADIKPDTDTGKFDLASFEKLPTVRLSTFYGIEEGASCKLKMQAPWTDTYSISFASTVVSRVDVYDAAGKQLESASENFKLDLKEGDIVYFNAVPVNRAVRLNVTAKENRDPLPFDVAEAPDPSQFSVNSADPDVDPLQSADLTYTPRPDTLYIYSNAPEALTPEVVNSCLMRQDVSNRSVFFSYEHQSTTLTDQGLRSNGVYYGYRVTNHSNEDMYVTVRNIGYQYDGAGCWYGQTEWMDFYNTDFSMENAKTLQPGQKQLYDRWLNFSEASTHAGFQPTTYRIPAGQYIYAIGGTTEDAFAGFNVANTANQLLTWIANGAVLFDVVGGDAEGAFYIYTKPKFIEEDSPQYKGNTYPYGDGWDEGYVVDGSAAWTFNDATQPQKLPVTFTNYYSDDAPVKGEPASRIPNVTPHLQKDRTEWATHINIQSTGVNGNGDIVNAPLTEAVGTDISILNTHYKGEPAKYGIHYYTATGQYPNYDVMGEYPSIGNWMKDYQDLFTFVNQGSKPRTVRINITPNGAIPVIFRNPDGSVITEDGLQPFFAVYAGSGHTDGDPFDIACHAEIVIPAHSVKQIIVEYNLMANDYGYIRHSVDLL